jgi:hypothetical protein
MKEHAKVFRVRKSQKSYNVSKRLHSQLPPEQEMHIDAGSGSKEEIWDLKRIKKKRKYP